MAKEIVLTQGQVAIVDDADFKWLNQWKWHAHKSKRDPSAKFYAVRTYRKTLPNGETKNASIKMHRQILGAPDDTNVDHEDGNGLNNQRHNLRAANKTQNNANRRLNRNNKSGFKGVSWTGRHWKAAIQVKGRAYNLGYFPTPQAAHERYKEAAVEHFGEFANFG